jgi:hypothetical protein
MTWGLCQPEKRLPEGWFPIRGDMVRHAEFAGLTVFEKLCLLDIIHRVHRHLYLAKGGFREGPFIEGDAQWAKRLQMSVEAFRLARRKIGRAINARSEKGLGWFTYTPGYRTQGGVTRRTEYHDCEFAKPARGIQSGAMARYTWFHALENLRKKQLEHADVVVCAMLAYFWKIGGGRENGSAVIPKQCITPTTGMSNSAFLESVGRLHDVMSDLYSFQEGHKYVDVSDWRGGPDRVWQAA